MDSWLIILFKSIVLFFLALVITRYIKKKTLSRSTPFDFISYASIAIIISLLSLNLIDNFYFGLIPLAVWGLMPLLLDYASMKSKSIYNVKSANKKWKNNGG